MFADAATEEVFRVRLHHMLDGTHPLVVQFFRMPWQHIEASVAYPCSRMARAGQVVPDVELLGEAEQEADLTLGRIGVPKLAC